MPWDFARELERWGPRGSDRASSLSAARAYCAHVAKSHYENFTVVSLFLPRRLIRHFHAVYAYYRWSDDLADETGGGQNALDLIMWWREQLRGCYSSAGCLKMPDPRQPVMIALRETIRRFDIPSQPFLDLLTASEQDQFVKQYATFDELLGYCRNSANPVGRLVLYLFECFDETRAALADEVCTGLQLANFWQDVSRDFAIGRIYIPQEDRHQFGYSDEDLTAKNCTPAFRSLMRFEVDRARGFFDRGENLLPLLPREARVDVDLFIRGGRAILTAIERLDYDVWSHRPEVTKWTKAKLLLGALARRFW
ncbi:MAG: squalene synthase HpnC [Planctomycetia bacterium]|nr:squalene synthase HpnC [Planctomycetia bacterium]